MPHPDSAVVTGAFSYTGRYVARRLIDQGVSVRTLSRHPDSRNDFGGLVRAAPLNFSDPEGLRRLMRGADVFYNTYWIRFPHGQTTFDHAVENTRTLLRAAERAGIERIVHFSVSNASLESPLPYIRAKAQVEEILKGLGVPYAIIRPTLIFGAGDLLLNNMAWALRHFPVFPVFGNGDYPVQPVYAEDLAAQAVQAGSQAESSIADAAGPETFSYDELLRLVAAAVGLRGSVGAHAPIGWPHPDKTGRLDDARRCADSRRGGRVDGWPVHVRRRADGHDQTERLAPRQPGEPRPSVRVRTQAQLPPYRAQFLSREAESMGRLAGRA